MIVAFEREETESMATSSASVSSTVIFGVRRLDGAFHHTEEEHSGVKPPHSKSRPQSLLQFIESFDDFFLQQMLSLSYDWFPADHHFADSCARSGEHNRRQEIIVR